MTDAQFAYWLYSQLTEIERETLAYLLEMSQRAVFDMPIMLSGVTSSPWSWDSAREYRMESVYLASYLAG